MYESKTKDARQNNSLILSEENRLSFFYTLLCLQNKLPFGRKLRDICIRIKRIIPHLTASLQNGLQILPSAEFLFFVTHKILRKSITLSLLDIKLLIFPIHLLRFLPCLPPKLDDSRSCEKVYSKPLIPCFALLVSLG